jgi:hypothetical protein
VRLAPYSWSKHARADDRFSDDTAESVTSDTEVDKGDIETDTEEVDAGREASTTHSSSCQDFDEGNYKYRVPSERGDDLVAPFDELKGHLRQYYAEHPESTWLTYEELVEAGVFEGTDYLPTKNDAMLARRLVIESTGFPLQADLFNTSSLREDYGVLHTARELRALLVYDSPAYAKEEDLQTLVDALVTDRRMLFVPSSTEMVEAIKLISPPLPLVFSNRELENDLLPEASATSMPEVERAIRRAQRAPLNLDAPMSDNPGESLKGVWNFVQDWLGRRGDMKLRAYSYSLTPRQVASELRDKGYLATEPPESEVETVLNKLVEEVLQAERRYSERKGRRKKAA